MLRTSAFSLLVALLVLATSYCTPEAPPASPEAPAAAAPAETLAQAPAQPPAIDDLPETNYYAIDTPHGRLVIRLYDDTPLHRDNFRKLAAARFFDGTTFHRVMQGFMIQGGDPYSRDDEPRNDGTGGPGYTLPAEIVPTHYHKRGALASARMNDQVNPRRESNGSQFYIVHGGRPIPVEVLDQMEAELGKQIRNPEFRFSEEARQAYITEGGAPHLDLQYTIFGELVEGFEVLDAIAAAETPQVRRQRDRSRPQDSPYAPIPMTVRPLPDYTPTP